MKVIVDMKEFSQDSSGQESLELETVGQFIEQIGSAIDDSRVITAVNLNSAPLDDTIWNSPISAHVDATIEVTTGKRSDYLRDRLSSAEHYLTQISEELEVALQLLARDSVEDGQTAIAGVLEHLLSFVEWYFSLLSLNAEHLQTELQEFQAVSVGIKTITDGIPRSIRANSWQDVTAALKGLQNELSNLRELCEKTATAYLAN